VRAQVELLVALARRLQRRRQNALRHRAVGPGKSYSPRHRMTCKSRKKGSQGVG
jgi:hypothetical protein